MPILDLTYFQTGELYIPNNRTLGARPTGTPQNTDLPTFIAKFERNFLYDALGVTFYNELQVELQKLPFNPDATETAEQKWIDLVNGRDYDIQGSSFRWDGLRGFEKDSVIAYFVKAMFLKSQESTYTTEGIVKLQPANASPFSYGRQYNQVWDTFCVRYQGEYINKFIRQNNIAVHNLSNRAYYNFIDAVIGRRDRFLGRNFFNINNTPSVSLFDYLRDSNDLRYEFPDFDFRFYMPSNVIGI